MKAPLSSEAVAVRFFLPSAQLAPYISTYYLTEVNVPEGDVLKDWLHPEWANLRFSRNAYWKAAIGSEPLRDTPAFTVSGPTSQCAQFVTGRARIWGVGILPLGWTRFFDSSADAYADRFCDGTSDPVFAGLAPLLDHVFGAEADPDAEAARIDAFMLGYLGARPAHEDEARIRAANSALIDHEIGAVAELADRMGMSARSLERLSLRAFGFPPKLLLRRQRFLRSLAQFMLDPSLTWISTLDRHYVDQAHFVRDFKRFMGMSPSTYAGADHPILRAAAQARAAAAGAAVQALHRP